MELQKGFAHGVLVALVLGVLTAPSLAVGTADPVLHAAQNDARCAPDQTCTTLHGIATLTRSDAGSVDCTGKVLYTAIQSYDQQMGAVALDGTQCNGIAAQFGPGECLNDMDVYCGHALADGSFEFFEAGGFAPQDTIFAFVYEMRSPDNTVIRHAESRSPTYADPFRVGFHSAQCAEEATSCWQSVGTLTRTDAAPGDCQGRVVLTAIIHAEKPSQGFSYMHLDGSDCKGVDAYLGFDDCGPGDWTTVCDRKSVDGSEDRLVLGGSTFPEAFFDFRYEHMNAAGEQTREAHFYPIDG